MELLPLRLVHGTSVPAPSSQIEAEFAKDRWDARNIAGLRYTPHRGDYYVKFSTIPSQFRSLVKEYAKFLVAADRTAATIEMRVLAMSRFFTFFLQQYPLASTLADLSTHDIDAFIVHLKAEASLRRLKSTNPYVSKHIQSLAGFLCHLERIQSAQKPQLPVSRIIWPHHYPTPECKTKSSQIKYIPQTVLQQLDVHLHQLAPTCIPVLILLRASGWRISDVLYLKLETCLEQDDGKYWLVGDIQKTRVLGHKIPITGEVAAVVLAQIAWVKQHYLPEENPNGWLFPAANDPRYRSFSQRYFSHNPRSAHTIQERLNALANKYQIREEDGSVFHFRLHAFRHAKAVELLNNGMSLVLVQQWMAHASPEMTLIYAKILDETMREAWEKTVQRGIVQFNEGKPAYVPGKKCLPMAGSNAFDPERVREHRHNVKMALGSCLKTAKIICKFVELPCFHCPAYVLTPGDLPALEAYEQQILERIEIGKQAGNAHWTEVNQNNLDERVRPAIALLKQEQIVTKTATHEREYTDEEWEQRQPYNQEQEHE
jgi:integrase